MPALLEEVRPKPATRQADNEFVDLGWRPIFKEHVNRLGVKFDRYSMQKIANRCNERIEKTNDFAPLTIRHTQDGGDFDPKVVGFCGPYKSQKMPDGTWAVYAKFRVFKEDEAEIKRYPRCSVEYWAGKDAPDAGWFDPVCLLGSETPELDLGIHYCKRGGKSLIRYQAVSPGGTNTHVPGMLEEKQRYQGGTLAQEDIQQIIAALTPVIEQTVKSQVAAMNPPGGGADDLNPLNALDGMDDDGGGDILDQALAEAGGDELGDEAGGEMGDDLGGDEEADPLSESLTAPGDEDDDTDIDINIDADDDDEELSASPSKAESPPKKKSKKAGKAKKLTDKPSTEKPDQYSAHGRESQSVSLDEELMAAETPEVTKYQKQITDLTAERDEYKTKYQKELEAKRTAETGYAELKLRVDAIDADRRQAVRYQKLFERQSQGYTFELADELKDCEAMTDEQFNKHVDERIPSRYSRIPIPGVTTKNMPIPATSRIELDAQRAAEKRQRYSKIAMANCLSNRELVFKQELERILAEDPESKKPAA